MQNANQKSILITGASSGIGKALAESYAAPNITLFLTGRNVARLEEVADLCRQKGAQVITTTIDVCKANNLRHCLESCDKKAPLDLVIANAGIAYGNQKPTENLERKIFATNLDGVLNTLYPTIELMQQRKKGQIAIMSSVAALISLPNAAAYCASKAAVKVYGEALRIRLKKDGIKVSVVCPGFITTPLTDQNLYKMPLIMPVEKAVQIIKQGLKKNKGLITFPKRMYFMLWSFRLLPAFLIEKIATYRGNRYRAR